MAAEHWVNDNGTARQTLEVWVNDNGTARRINEIWVNDNGTARLIFAGAEIQEFGPGGSVTSGTSTFTLFANGTRTSITSPAEGPGQVWIDPQVGMSQFEVRATEGARTGSGSYVGTLNTFQSLASNRSWSVSTSSPISAATWSLQFEFRRASGGDVLATSSVTIVSTP